MLRNAKFSKVKILDELFVKLKKIEKLTEEEETIACQFIEAAKNHPATIENTPTPLALIETLTERQQELNISNQLAKKLKAHIEVMELLMQLFGMSQRFGGLMELSLQYSNFKNIGADDVLPLVEFLFPDDHEQLIKYKGIIDMIIDMDKTTFYPQAYLSSVGHIDTVLNQKVKSELIIEEKIRTAAEFAMQHENELIALSKISRAIIEYKPINAALIKKEYDKTHLSDIYFPKDSTVIIVNDKAKEPIQRVKEKDLSASVHLSLIIDQMSDDLQTEARAKLIQQHTTLEAYLSQRPIVDDIGSQLQMPTVEPRVILQRIKTIITHPQNAKQFEIPAKENPAVKFIKTILSAVTFGLAKKLWAEPKSFFELTKIFSSTKSKQKSLPITNAKVSNEKSSKSELNDDEIHNSLSKSG